MSVLFITTHSQSSHIRVGSWYFRKSIQSIDDDITIIPAPLSPLHVAFINNKNVRSRFYMFFATLFGIDSVRSNEWQLLTLFPAADRGLFNTGFCFNYSYLFSMPKLSDKFYDVVYIDNPYHYSLLRYIKYSKLIFRIPDYISSGERKASPALINSVGKITELSDLVVTASEVVSQQVLENFSKDAVVISNGVDCSRFDMNPGSFFTSPFSSKKIVFVGAFNYWVNLELIMEVANYLPNVELLLVGELPFSYKSKIKQSNITLVGSISPSEIPSLLQGCAVGIVPFDVINYKDFVDGINPLKAYEYLAAGIPVVSTDFAGARGISPYVTTASSAEEFCQAVANYLDNPPDRDAVRKTAEPYDWSVVLKPFEDFVKKSLGKSEES